MDGRIARFTPSAEATEVTVYMPCPHGCAEPVAVTLRTWTEHGEIQQGIARLVHAAPQPPAGDGA